MDDSKKAEFLFNEGFCMLYGIDFLPKTENYCSLIENDPKYKVRRELFIPENEEEHFEKIIDLFTEAIKLKPDLKVAYNYRGLANQQLLYNYAAIDDHTKALNIDPAYASAYFYRGQARWEESIYPKAIDDFDLAVDLGINDIELFLFRGHSKECLKDYSEAILDYSTAIEINPDYVESYTCRANAKWDFKDYSGAISDFNLALKLEPDNTLYTKHKANLKRYSGDYDGAIADLTEIINRKPENSFKAEALFWRGEVYRMLEKLDEAIRDYSETIKIAPDFDIAYESRGKVKAALNDFEGAEADFDKFMELSLNF